MLPRSRAARRSARRTPSFPRAWYSSVRAWIGARPWLLLRFDVRHTDDGGPFDQLALDVGAELLRGIRGGGRALARQLLDDVALMQDLRGLVVYTRPDFPGGAGGARPD